MGVNISNNNLLVLILQTMPDYHEASYIEGFIVARDFPSAALEWAWIERNGEIIDPLDYPTPCAYFPGLRFDGVQELEHAIEDLRREPSTDRSRKDHRDADAIKNERQRLSPGNLRQHIHYQLPIFRRFGWRGSESSTFHGARQEADGYFLMDNFKMAQPMTPGRYAAQVAGITHENSANGSAVILHFVSWADGGVYKISERLTATQDGDQRRRMFASRLSLRRRKGAEIHVIDWEKALGRSVYIVVVAVGRDTAIADIGEEPIPQQRRRRKIV